MKKIRTKITILIASGIFLTLLPVSFAIVQGLQHQAMEDLKREATIMADFLSDAVSASVDLQDETSVEFALESVERRKSILFVQVYTTQEELLGAYQSQPIPELTFETKTTLPQSYDSGKGLVICLYPIPSPVDFSSTIGTLVLGMSTRPLEVRMWRFKMIGVFIGITLFLLGCSVAWIIGNYVASPVMKLSHVARQIANGDLAQTAHLNLELTDEIGELAKSFDHMRESLQELIKHIKQAGLMMQSSSDGIFMAVSQLAAALEEQSASVIETTATMESLTATSRKIAGNTDVVVSMAERTRTHSQKGVAIAEETIEKMEEIHSTNKQFLQKITILGERSEKIGDVIQIIHNIADRTKLIAFNAALEAVGAKDIVGKRFNVVAIEIRRLADTIIESTQEIESNILEIQEGIRELVLSSDTTTSRILEGTRHTKTSGEWLREILDAAICTTQEAKQIASAIQEQRRANEQILLALKEISDGTKQFVSAGNQVSSSANEMKRLAEEFHILIDKFELDNA